MISVALCTYNGKRFIREQIQSILDQKMGVDEIVVCDDGSKDDTVQIVRELAKNTEVKIRIYVNESSLGVKGNFKKAIELCTGDYVFLSDQDDYWLPNKVETIITWFAEHPDKSVVFTNAYLVDEKRNRYDGRTQFQGVGFRKLQQDMVQNGHGLEVFLVANRATGATMAFKREKVEVREDDWGEMLHDEYIAIKALLKDELGVLSEPLIEYRQHAKQQVGSHISDKEIEAEYDEWYFYEPSKSLENIRTWQFDNNGRINEHESLLVERDRMRYSSNGIVCELLCIKQYRKIYGPYWWRYLKADMRKTIGYVWHRIVKSF